MGLTILGQIENWTLPFPYGQVLFRWIDAAEEEMRVNGGCWEDSGLTAVAVAKQEDVQSGTSVVCRIKS